MTQILENTKNVVEELLSPEGLKNPYPIYDRLRETEPVYWNPVMQMWMVMGYADIMSSLNDERFSSDWPSTFRFIRPLTEDEEPIFQRLLEFFGRWMQANDNPKHHRIRSLVQKAFTPRMMQRMETQIQQVVDECIARVKESGEMDVYQDLALPLPSVVISRMLGVPDENREEFTKLSQSISSFIGIGNPAPGQLAQIEQDVLRLKAIVNPIIEARRIEPREDLISALVQSENQAEGLNAEEIISNCVFLLFAGHDTTTNLISNGMLVLLEHPEQLALLQAQPELLKSAIEELGRYDAPIQWIPRVLKADVELDGKPMQQGQYVGLWIAAANYDPANFENPYTLDITRSKRTLSFGHGPHYCLGSALARMEGAAAIGTLLAQVSKVELAGEAVRSINFTIRGLRSLPIKFQAK